MAVETLVEPRIHDGDGATVDFAAPRVLAAADIVVSLIAADGTTTAQTLGVDYSLIGSVAAGYTVRFTTAPAAGVTVAIERDTPPTQPSRFKDLERFPAARAEGAFDRGAESVQDLRVKLGRALLAPPGEDGATLPPRALWNGKVFVPLAGGEYRLIDTTDLDALGALTAEIEALSAADVRAAMLALKADLDGANTLGAAKALLNVAAPSIVTKDADGTPTARTLEAQHGLGWDRANASGGNPSVKIADVAAALERLGGKAKGIDLFNSTAISDVLAALKISGGVAGQAYGPDGSGNARVFTPSGSGNSIREADEEFPGDKRLTGDLRLSGRLIEDQALQVFGGGAIIETITADARTAGLGVHGRERLLFDNTALGGYAHFNLFVKENTKTSGENHIHEAWISRFDDVPSPGSDHWDHWLVFQSPLHHLSGLPGAPATAQAFRAVSSELNPQNRLADDGLNLERRLAGNWMGGVQIVPETQDFTSLLNGVRPGYNVMFGMVLAQSLYTSTINDRHAQTYFFHLVETNALAPDGRALMASGYKPFVTGVTISSGGSGYTAGDVGRVVSLEGPGSALVDRDALVIIKAVSAGAVTELELWSGGYYETAPSNPVATSGSTDGSGLTITASFSGEADIPHALLDGSETWHTGIDFTRAAFVDTSIGNDQAVRLADGQKICWRNSAGSEIRQVLGAQSDQTFLNALNNAAGVFIGSENFGSVVAHFDASAATRNAYLDFRADNGIARISAAGSATNADIEIIPKGSGQVKITELVAFGLSDTPSLSADQAAAVLGTNSTVQLSFGGYSGSGFEAWLQTKDSGNSGAAYGLALNPLGGFVSINKRVANHALDVAGNVNSEGAYLIDGNTVIDDARLQRQRPYTVATLPAAGTAGRTAFASDGRKAAEGVGAGTGVLVFDDGSNWIAADTGATVAA